MSSEWPINSQNPLTLLTAPRQVGHRTCNDLTWANFCVKRRQILYHHSSLETILWSPSAGRGNYETKWRKYVRAFDWPPTKWINKTQGNNPGKCTKITVYLITFQKVVSEHPWIAEKRKHNWDKLAGCGTHSSANGQSDLSVWNSGMVQAESRAIASSELLVK